jgi:hypothetical protein
VLLLDFLPPATIVLALVISSGGLFWVSIMLADVKNKLFATAPFSIINA